MDQKLSDFYPGEYNSWKSMRIRCLYPKAANYQWYGGRGISICQRWSSFALFIEDVGPKPTPKHSLDRIDGNGNYEPSNCRWATQSDQLRNRRSWKISEAARQNRILINSQRTTGIGIARRLDWSMIEERLSGPGKVSQRVLAAELGTHQTIISKGINAYRSSIIDS